MEHVSSICPVTVLEHKKVHLKTLLTYLVTFKV